MVIILNDDDTKAEPQKAVVEAQMPHDPPPTYTSVQSTSTSQPLSSPSSSYTPNNLVNYVSISRKHGSIKETMTVDPSLYIPESLRDPSPSDGESSNVRLETIHGQIEAEITLVQNNTTLETQSPQRANLRLSSTHGSIKATIFDHPRRPPFLLTAKASEGSIRLTLPRSFSGPITVSYVHGAVKASALGAHFITLSEANGKMKGFIGDLSKYTERHVEGKGWKGDELVLDLKHGDAKLRFDQDDVTSAGEDGRSQQTKSFFLKFFGLS